MQLEKEQNRQRLAVNALTRAQTKKLAEEEKRDEQLSAKDEAQPIPIAKPEGNVAEDEPEALHESVEDPVEDEPAALHESVEGPVEDEPAALHESVEDPVEDEPAALHESVEDPVEDEPAALHESVEDPVEDEPAALHESVEGSVEDEPEALHEEDSVEEDGQENEREVEEGVQVVCLEDEQLVDEWPVPDLANDDSDRQELMKQQREDKTLESARQWADKGEKGYSYLDGLLVHTMESEQGDLWRRLVIPQPRRKDILRLSHSSLTGGHFSHRKTEGALRRVFTWPGVSKEVAQIARRQPELSIAKSHYNPSR